MKKLATIIWLSTWAASALAQGVVTFASGTQPPLLITYGPIGGESPLPANDAGAFYFALFISVDPAGPFTFTGVYATNSARAGAFGPATYQPIVPGWPGFTTMFYEVAGWSSNLGPVWNPGWLVDNLPAPGDDPVWSEAPTNSYFGLSGIASGDAIPTGPPPVGAPPYPLFGGVGLTGFNLAPVVQQVGLSATNLGTSIGLSWTPSGGTLQSSTVVGPAATWSDVGTQNPTNLPITGPAMFFRVTGGPYSTNIVGFATVTIPPGYSLLANPLDAGKTNGANEIMPVLDGEIISTSFGKVTYDSGAGGWLNLDTLAPAQPPSLPPGEGFFFYNPNPTPTNFTFVGQVVPGPSSANCLDLQPGFNMIGSPLPATVDTITNPPVQLPVIDGMIISEWIGGKYVQTMYDSSAGGWVQTDDATPSLPPPYSIGQGFYLYNPSPVPLVWCQSLSFATMPGFFTQDQVLFANDPSTLVTYGPPGHEALLPANDAGGFYFGLLISSNATGPFAFTGTYATNITTAGTFGPGTYSPVVPGWAPGASMFYEVAGWSANLGKVWNPAWLVNNRPAPAGAPVWSGVPTNSYFGLSGIALGAPSGPCPPSCGSPSPLFGGTGLQGFNLALAGQQLVALSATTVGNNIVIGWTPSGGTLQSSPVVGPGANWSTVGSQNPTNFPIAKGPIFFRVSGGAYSSNMVGFATVTVPAGYSLLANPLGAGATNGANEIMPVLNGETIATWNGSSYNTVMYDSTAGGWVGADDATAAQPPSLPPGKGFFFFNPNSAPTNFTFVGQVVPGPSSTNCLAINPGYQLLGSPLPGTVDTITNVPVSLPIIDGMSILQWNGSNYKGTLYDSIAGGWVQLDDTTPSVAPSYSIGQGFFFFNPLAGAYNWCQTLP